MNANEKQIVENFKKSRKDFEATNKQIEEYILYFNFTGVKP